MTEGAGPTRREGLAELAEDAVGFGGQELRLTRDLLLRPRAVMDAYDAHGSTAGGLYPKPLRYYLTLNGLYLLLIALLGGFEQTIVTAFANQDRAFLGEIAAAAGKSEGALIADIDQWYSLLLIPLFALFMGGAVFLLVRRWSPGPDRQDFRQTFTFLNASSLITIPAGLVMVIIQSQSPAWLLVTSGAYALVYARVGAGRWWTTRTGAWLKGALLLTMIFIGTMLASIPAAILSLLAGRFLP